VKRQTSDEDRERILRNAANYTRYLLDYKEGEK
jgi:hypothetical protein